MFSMEKDVAKYQTEHLFLLVGKNPLPNCVAIKLLAAKKARATTKGTTVHLVHSSETIVYAQRLEDKLKSDYHFAERICVQPSQANKIRRKIEDRLSSIKGNIGLNYTGGTKAMAVHVYRAIASKDSSATFSYLDPRGLAMLIDPTEGVQSEICFNLGKPNGSDGEKEYFGDTRISLDELLFLHKLEKFHDFRSAPRWIYLAEAIQYEAIDCDSWWDFQETSRRVFEGAQKATGYRAYDEHNRRQMENELRKQSIKFPNDLSTLILTFETQFPGRNLISSNQLVLSNLPNDVSQIEFVNFLRGAWLEDFTLSRMIEIRDSNGKTLREKCYLESCGSSLEIALPHPPGNSKAAKRRFFELDVVAMRGYRLFALSCTVQGRIEKVKHKLFEAVHRAKQIGGEEARIGLVCLARPSDINKIKSQLEDDHIEVFGREDLRLLEQRLEEWFNREGERG